jgi:kynureninase
MDTAALASHPNPLAGFYRHFDVANRLLLTGHSHQAWPDVGLAGQQQAWHDAARHLDDKWTLAFEQAARVREGFCRLLHDTDPDAYALGTSTHELLVRWLSALPLAQRPRIVTTTGEFHTMRRQLDRLGEGWLQVEKVDAEPVATLSERLAAAVDGRTAAVMLSAVMFRDAAIVPHLQLLAEAAARAGAELLIDAYHALGVVPFDLSGQGLDGAFVVGGGYKYCQLGEGNCFLRVPPGSDLRPVITGWYAEFHLLEQAPEDGGVPFPAGGARYAGSTYDPTSHYRAARVFDFFASQGLTDRVLRQISQSQVGRLREAFDLADLDPAVIRRADVALEEVGGFLALHSPLAARLQAALAQAGVRTDHREDVLRLGPAPYLSDRQLDDAMTVLVEAVIGLN